MGKFFKWAGAVVVGVLVIEWALALVHAPVANSGSLILGAIVALVIGCVLFVVLFVIMWLIADRQNERATFGRIIEVQYEDRWHERNALVGIANRAFDALQISQESEHYLAGLVADGVRIKEIRGEDTLLYPDGRRLPAGKTDLTKAELDFIYEEQAR